MNETQRPVSRLAYLCLQPAEPGDTAFTHVEGMVDALRRLEFEIDVFRPDPGSARRGLAGRLRESLTVTRQVVTGAAGADALYVRLHPVALPAVRWAKRRGKRVVVEVNGPPEDWLMAWPALRSAEPVLRRMLGAVLRRCDAAVTVTHGLAAWVTAEAGEELHVEVVPNGVDPRLFRPGADVPRGLPDQYAVFVGELAPWQGVEDLLAAATHPDWPEGLVLVVVGSGAMSGAVEHVAHSHPTRVRMLGRADHGEIPGILCGAAVALVSSQDRAGVGIAPLKLFEALACGAPVVATNVPDIGRYFAGPLVDPGDIAGWAREVKGVVSAPRASLSRADGADHSWDARARSVARILTCGS